MSDSEAAHAELIRESAEEAADEVWVILNRAERELIVTALATHLAVLAPTHDRQAHEATTALAT
jgi:hypothetical protein